MRDDQFLQFNVLAFGRMLNQGYMEKLCPVIDTSESLLISPSVSTTIQSLLTRNISSACICCADAVSCW